MAVRYHKFNDQDWAKIRAAARADWVEFKFDDLARGVLNLGYIAKVQEWQLHRFHRLPPEVQKAVDGQSGGALSKWFNSHNARLAREVSLPDGSKRPLRDPNGNPHSPAVVVEQERERVVVVREEAVRVLAERVLRGEVPAWVKNLPQSPFEPGSAAHIEEIVGVTRFRKRMEIPDSEPRPWGHHGDPIERAVFGTETPLVAGWPETIEPARPPRLTADQRGGGLAD